MDGDWFMHRHIHFDLELPADLDRLHFPEAVSQRLQKLLDRQDRGEALSAHERAEAEGLTNMADLLSLLRLRSERVNGN